MTPHVQWFPATPESVSGARHFVTDLLGDRYPELVREDVALMVSELAANAVLHAATDFAVSLTERLDELEVGITDRNAKLPHLARPTALGGRGLGIVDTLAVAWGCREADEGKTVFFLVRLPFARLGSRSRSGRRRGARRLELLS